MPKQSGPTELRSSSADPAVPVETTVRGKRGPRDFYYSRKITLSNYDPSKKYETEDFGVEHDSFEEARVVVQEAVQARIQELRGIKEVKIKE